MEAHHGVLWAKVIDHKRSANGSGHVEQTVEISMTRGMEHCFLAYLMTVAQPKTTLSEVLPPVMLGSH